MLFPYFPQKDCSETSQRSDGDLCLLFFVLIKRCVAPKRRHFTPLASSTVMRGRVIGNLLISMSWGSLHNIFPTIDNNAIYAARWKDVEIFGERKMTHAESGNVD